MYLAQHISIDYIQGISEISICEISKTTFNVLRINLTLELHRTKHYDNTLN
jgi:hypothetical protein